MRRPGFPPGTFTDPDPVSVPNRRAEKRQAINEQQERDEAARIERAQRTTWRKIWDLEVDDDLKEILWAITEKLEL